MVQDNNRHKIRVRRVRVVAGVMIAAQLADMVLLLLESQYALLGVVALFSAVLAVTIVAADRYPQVSGWVISLGLLLLVIGAIPLSSAINQPLVLGYVVPPLIAGFLLSSTAVVIVGAGIGLNLLGQSVYLNTQTIPVVEDFSVTFGILFLIYVVCVGLLWLVLRYLERSVQQAEQATTEAQTAQQATELREQELRTNRDALESMNQQQRAMLETIHLLEAPVLLLANNVLLVPIIGELTSDRVEKITDRLLQSVHRQRARGVILDISGINAVNEHIAHYLTGLVQACQLMGAQVILSGMSIGIAEQLARYDADSKTFVATSSLEMAMGRMSQSLN